MTQKCNSWILELEWRELIDQLQISFGFRLMMFILNKEYNIYIK